MLLVRTDSTRRLLALHAAPRRRRRQRRSRRPGFDPLLASVEFSFKVECPTDFDCEPVCDVPAGARRAAGDRLPREGLRLVPRADARPAQPARARLDGAHAGRPRASRSSSCSPTSPTSCRTARTRSRPRRTSRTARRRTSLRRHARLVDYLVHEGANARAWVRVFVAGEGVALATGTPLLTRVPDLPHVFEPGRPEHRAALAARAETFETIERRRSLRRRTSASTSGRGATTAAACRAARRRRRSLGDHPQLKAGDVLVLAEVAGPPTGNADGRRPGEARGGAADERRAVERPVRRPLREPADERGRRRHRDRVGRGGRAAVPALHLRRGAAGPRRRRGVGEHRARRSRPHDRRRGARRGAGAVLERVAAEGCDPCEHEPDPEPMPIRFRPTLANAPVTQARPSPTPRSPRVR